MLEHDWKNLRMRIDNRLIMRLVTDCLQLAFSTPEAVILAEGGKEAFPVKPSASRPATESMRQTFAGPAREFRWNWRDPDGHILIWRVGLLQNMEGIKLSASYYNGSELPVRLREFRLNGSGEETVVCRGDPSKWLLSTLTHEMRIGDMQEVLPSINESTKRMWEGWKLPVPDRLPEGERYNDGRWRIYRDFLTLYTEGGTKGMVMGPVGEPAADLGFECKVEAGRMKMDIVCEMNDVLVEPGQTRDSQEILFLMGPYRDSMNTLLRWIASTHGQRTHRGPVTGWCSWYDLAGNITKESIMSTIQAFQSLKGRVCPDVIQIDDGYQRQVGDWECNDKFPGGFDEIVEGIRDTGAMPGIWLAPLAVHESTGLLEKHPDWFQRDPEGELLGEANNWGPRSRWLDPTHPGVQRFIGEILRRKKEEGFTYFKIDFNEISGRCRFCDASKTRLQAMRDLYRLYREEVGEESYLLSCSGFARGTIGYADASRIGPDSCDIWSAAHSCTIREAIRATGMNAAANGIFYANDPDVTYLKIRDLTEEVLQEVLKEPGRVQLTLDGLRTWHGFVGLLGGLALISDPIQKQEYAWQLRMLEILMSPCRERGMPLHPGNDRDHKQFGFPVHRPWGEFACVLLWNSGEEAEDVVLDGAGLEMPENHYHVWSFWDGKYLGKGGQGFTAKNLAPQASVLLRLTVPSEDDEFPVVVGSDLHISMGAAEIEDIAVSDCCIRITLNDAGARDGSLFIHSKKPLRLEKASGCEVAGVEYLRESIWKVELKNRSNAGKSTFVLACGIV